ncbi:MAG: hypothetical protein KJP04_00640, partial [Arenicella sp.]|nr:hypothetical protein [Arenicella sp.]
MSKPDIVCAPLAGTVFEVAGSSGSKVEAGQAVLTLESMKVHVPVSITTSGVIEELWVKAGDTVDQGAALFSYQAGVSQQDSNAVNVRESPQSGIKAELLNEFRHRRAMSLDERREEAATGRHKKNYCTARENLHDLVDEGTFVEYGQLAVAAQRQRRDFEDLQASTAADGIITGVGSINGDLFEHEDCRAAIVINDYSVLAGTQGFFHHQKLDRILAVATDQKLPVIMYTEGGGGRPGDTD